MLCLLVVASCSSNDGIEDETGGNAKTSCAVTGAAHTISHCSAFVQVSYHTPANVTLPENYNWWADFTIGVCYGRTTAIANDKSDRVHIMKDGDYQSDNVYGAGYAYDNDTTYYNALIDYCEPNTTYYYCTFFTYYGKTYYGAVKKITTKTLSKSVDLGLSVNWAAWNVGATSSEQPGDRYAYGEIERMSSNVPISQPKLLRTSSVLSASFVTPYLEYSTV